MFFFNLERPLPKGSLASCFRCMWIIIGLFYYEFIVKFSHESVLLYFILIYRRPSGYTRISLRGHIETNLKRFPPCLQSINASIF